MNKPGALDQLPAGVQTMVKENAQTLGELETKLPSFTEKDARKISSPTLLMYGARGTKILRAIIKILAKSIPDNQLIAIPDSTHFPHFENSDTFNEQALQFLSLC
jgi:pimeloyl-ACP methyl ester carboxylesterase